jgi:hypothetical protein
MKHTAAYDLLAYNNTADLAPRKPSPVSPHSFPEDLKCLPRDDVVLVAGGSSRGRSKLSLRNGCSFFHYHPTHFGLGTDAAGREPHHPERNDILRFNTKPKRFERQG